MWWLLDFQIYDRKMNRWSLLALGVLIRCSDIPTLLLQADLSRSLLGCWTPPPHLDLWVLNSTSVQSPSNYLWLLVCLLLAL